MDRTRKPMTTGQAELLLRPANDSLRPLSTIEVALKVRPAPVLSGTDPVWRLDPQYGRWLARTIPPDQHWQCTHENYERLVRPADARYTLEQMHARLADELARTGGYALAELAGWRHRNAMFVIGGHRLKPLLEFLFAWG